MANILSNMLYIKIKKELIKSSLTALYGGGCGIRTRDPLRAGQML